MSKVELLCPAGNFEAFEAALYNGADAIFLAGKMYGARASAANFSLEEIKRATELAHLYGVKIHVTLNTLLHDSEIAACREYIRNLSEIGVDALIVQDLGVMDILRHEFRNIEIHASTQMHIHNRQGIVQCEKWGISRCVVARESSLEQIRSFCQENMEIEVFVQGAYCVSYSGECHMSNNIGSRSANRGECAQSCRLPYELWVEKQHKKERVETEGKYLLSLKDLSALEHIGDLIECGVSSFKIEGRMKRPEYVACMCRIYRKAIDAYENHEEFHVTEEIKKEMKKIFNRGFTSGYLDKKEGLSIMSTIRPNHQGVRIGKVIGFHRDKMKIQLEGDLCQHDGIRILNDKEDQGFIVNYLYKNGKLVSKASNEIVELQKVNVHVGDVVMKTSDVHQLEELSSTISAKNRKIKIRISAVLKKDAPLKLKFWEERACVEIASENVCEKARTVALSKQRIQEQLCKLGNTPFVCEKIEIEVDEDVSFPISVLNEMRRKASLLLQEKLMNLKKEFQQKIPYEFKAPALTQKIRVKVLNEKQALVAMKYPVEVVVPSSLYHKMENVTLSYPRVYDGRYSQQGEIHDVSGISCKGIASPYMNCMNAYSANVLFNEGIECVALSYECNEEEIKRLVSEYESLTSHKGNFEVCLYGRMENMVLENCIIKSQLHTSKHCQQCHRLKYTLKDVKNKEYPLWGDENCRMVVYHSDVMDRIEKVKDFQKMGIENFSLSFTFEDEEEMKKVLNRLFIRM